MATGAEDARPGRGDAPDWSAFAPSHPGVLLLTVSHGTVTSAHGSQATLDIDPDRLVGAPFDAALHPADRLVLREGARGTVRLRHGEGSWRWFDAHVTMPGDVHVIVLVDVTEHRRTAASEARFRALVTNTTDVIAITDAAGTITYASPGISAMLGWDDAEVVGRSSIELISPEDRDVVRHQLERLLDRSADEPVRFEARALHREGSTRWVDVIMTNHLANPDVGGIVANVRDVSDQRRAVQALRETARDTARLTQVLGATSDLVAITDREGRLLYVNDAFCEFFDVERAQLDEFDFTAVTPGWAQERYAHETIPALSTDGIWSGEFAYFRRGIEVTVSALFIAHRGDDGHLEFVSSITRDISAHKALEERLAHQATHDPLTGLPNRALFLDRLNVALARAQRSRGTVGVLFCDLDHFKVVNDSLGHGAGDQLLVSVAGRLRAVVRPSDTVARFGGDEFVVLCEDLDDEGDGYAIAERIGEALRPRVTIEGNELFVSGSVGMAFAKGGDVEPEALLRDADAAMYRAKARGRARFEVFDEEMRRSAVDRLQTERALRQALDRRELRVLYLPRHDLATGEVSGFEALLRWDHPERGLLPAAEFLQIAEETGLIIRIGHWVGEQACALVTRMASAVNGNGRARPRVAINLSARELAQPTLVADFAALFERAGIDGSSIEIEISERVAMDGVDARLATFEGFKALGVGIVIDDFGTGHSALAYLRRFPVDALKIDRELIGGLGTDANDEAIVAAIISMAHSLGVRTIAEGVETDEQLDRLRHLGCDAAQGHVFAPPLPSADVIDRLTR